MHLFCLLCINSIDKYVFKTSVKISSFTEVRSHTILWQLMIIASIQQPTVI